MILINCIYFNMDPISTKDGSTASLKNKKISKKKETTTTTKQ